MVKDADVPERSDHEPPLIVGIGASAGGLEACREFLSAMPSDTGMAFVVVMHLDPSRESQMAEILGRETKMVVTQATSPVLLERGHVYVIAPDSSLALRHGVLYPKIPNDPDGRRKPIDAFFSSMAAARGQSAVAIVLSGTGNNGSLGIRDVKAAGGLCIAQEPRTAQYPDMPRNAIATGVVDHVVTVEEMPSVLLAWARHYGARAAVASQDASANSSSAFELILDLLGHTYGVSFRGSYKRGTLERRTERRIGLKQLSDWDAYYKLLQKDPAEVATLYRDLLIDVTQFFRDQDVWDQLEREIIPGLIAAHDTNTPLKLWVAGCATGEEAYSFAIVLLEQLEQLDRELKVQIFATDVAEDALATARRGRYPATIQDDVSPARLERFFRRTRDEYEVTREVRETVTFATHNLLADPPFSGLALVSCRNVLIYLEAHAQHRVLQVFYFALKLDGILLLGASETVGRHADLFEAVSNTARIYRPTPMTKAVRQHEPQWTTQERRFLGVPPRAVPPAPRGSKVSRVIEQIVLSRFTWACVAVTDSLEIRSFFGPTHEFLVQPTGEARMDLLAWAKPGLYPRLREGLKRAADGKERVILSDLWMDRESESARVECTIEPITPLPGEARLFLVAFRELPAPPADAEAAGDRSIEPLVRQLEAELKVAREELQGTVEHLQSSNEEYRASHEELLSLNEELQSNNEELQASKEELQSLNEEMVTINRQLEDRNNQLRTLNTDINNLLVSTHIPIIFLDRELRIRRFTPAATELMHLIAADVGRSAEDIRERIRDGTLLQDAKTVIDKLIPIVTDVQTDDGRWYTRRVVPYRTEDDRIDGVCISFHDVTISKKASEELDEARIFAETIVETTRTALVVLDRKMCVISANTCFHDMFHSTKEEIAGQPLFELGRRQWNLPPLRARLERVLHDGQELKRFEVEQEFDQLGRRVMQLSARAMWRWARPPLILLAIEDVTEHKLAQQMIEARADELAQEHQRKDEFLAMLGHELRNPLAALLHGLDLLELVATEPPRVEQVRGMMMRQAKRIGAMLDELLDIARLNAGKIAIARELIDVSEVIKAAQEGVTPLLVARRSKLRVRPAEPDGVIVCGDFVRLTQVVENLLSNAAKYSEEGSDINLSLEADDDWARIRVRDTGIGMDPELLSHIFELFVQDTRALDRAAGGLGLGLPLVKRVVEMHGGRVEASSPGRGKGSEFVVTLPRTSEHRAVERGRRQERVDAEGPQRRILVVDDEVDAASTLTELLELHGHEACGVGDGQAALELARSFRPDVVLLDLGLPKMNGYEVAQRLREEHGSDSGMRLVALTGYQKDAERLEQAGFDHHVIKPPNLPALLEWLRQGGSDGEPSGAG